MNTRSTDTEGVVRRHLQTFVERKGLDAIVSDYADEACLLSESSPHRGRPEIRRFFEDFIAGLAPGAIDEFALRSLRVDGDVAYITWSAGRELPFGTDTFVVRHGKIVAQTVAIYTLPQ